MIKFYPTPLKDLFVAQSTALQDERGSFMRLYCAPTQQKELGFTREIVQINRSFTAKKGTIRGLHFQRAPALEAKTVRCTRGAVFDVCVDLREDSDTFMHHFTIELNERDAHAVLIPEGFAHGFQALTDDCEMIYLHSAPYSKEHEGGLLFNDPRLLIEWPLTVTSISPRDLSFAPIDDSFKGITHAV